MMMRRHSLLWLVAAMLASPAHAQLTLKRLFHTPAERAQIDASRQQPSATPGTDNAPPQMNAQTQLQNAAVGVPFVPAMPPPAAGSAVPTQTMAGLPPPMPVPDLPPNVTPEMVASWQANSSLPPGATAAAPQAVTPPAMPQAMTPPGMPQAIAQPGMPQASAPPGMPAAMSPPTAADAQAAAAVAAAPSTLALSGVLRSGHGETTVWINDQAQRTSKANAKGDVTVTLSSGKRIKLRPGQRYDFNEGRIKDVAQP